MKVYISEKHEKNGVLIRALVKTEDDHIEAVDFRLPYQLKPYRLCLVQNPLFDYEGMMARHDNLERIRKEHNDRTGFDPPEAKWSDIRGLWLVAHWYIVEDYLEDNLTVGMTVAAWEGLNRNKSIRLIQPIQN